MICCKSWERYGIHALEEVYPFLEPGGWLSVANTGTAEANIVHIKHKNGVSVILSVIKDMYGGFGYLDLYGTHGAMGTRFEDTFGAFKAQLVTFVDYLRSGKLPFEFEETVEQMKIIIADIRSRDDSGREVMLSEIKP
jgi:hypothetical protein